MLRRESWLYSLRELLKLLPGMELAQQDRVGLGLQLRVGLAVGARELDQAQVDGVLLVEAVLVLLVVLSRP